MKTSTGPIGFLALVLSLTTFALGCGDDGSSYDYYVEAESGDDMNPGTSGEPFATITQALSVALSGERVKVRPGIYDEVTGEVFPLMVPEGVDLVGDPSNLGADTLIDGGGPALVGLPFIIGSAAVTLADDASLSGFTVRNTIGDTIRVGVDIVGADVTVKDNAVRDVVFGPSGGTGSGILATTGFSARLIGNEVTGNEYGINLASGGADALLEDNVATENVIGVSTDSGFYYFDFGGGRLGSRGGNVFSCNIDNDLAIWWGNTVDALDNDWDHTPPTIGSTAGLDLRLNAGDGDSAEPDPVFNVSNAGLVSAPCP